MCNTRIIWSLYKSSDLNVLFLIKTHSRNLLVWISKYLAFKKKIVIHKSTVALCLTLCLFFRTFYRKYAYSCYAYKKKLVYIIERVYLKTSLEFCGPQVSISAFFWSILIGPKLSLLSPGEPSSHNNKFSLSSVINIIFSL